jgi:hypothetical protein
MNDEETFSEDVKNLETFSPSAEVLENHWVKAERQNVKMPDLTLSLN